MGLIGTGLKLEGSNGHGNLQPALRIAVEDEKPKGQLKRKRISQLFARTKRQESTPKVIVGTVKRSMAAIASLWFRRKASQRLAGSGSLDARFIQREMVLPARCRRIAVSSCNQKWELSSDGIVCGTAFGDPRNMAKSGYRLGSRNKGKVKRRPVIWWQRFQRSTTTLPNLWCSGNNGFKVLRELRSCGWKASDLPESQPLSCPESPPVRNCNY